MLFVKTLNHIFNNITPKYITVNHKISKGETFDIILDNYSISESEKIKIKNKLSKIVNLNKLSTSQIIKLKLQVHQIQVSMMIVMAHLPYLVLP